MEKRADLSLRLSVCRGAKPFFINPLCVSGTLRRQKWVTLNTRVPLLIPVSFFTETWLRSQPERCLYLGQFDLESIEPRPVLIPAIIDTQAFVITATATEIKHDHDSALSGISPSTYYTTFF